jgi:iron complex outermembrane recepter protein
VFRPLLSVLLLTTSIPALAQRTTSNAVTAADDAFGRAVGTEKIGIYSTEEVRGFNPVEAGNVRIEGLYFDQQGIPSNRLIDSSAIRVGFAARGYPFPAPTGIADLKIDRFDGQSVISAEIEAESANNLSGSIQVKMPLAGETLGLTLGAGARRGRVPNGRSGNFHSEALVLNWKPSASSEVIGFVSRFEFTKGRQAPIVFPSGNFTPPRQSRSLIQAQPWAGSHTIGYTNGIVAKLPLGGLHLDVGLFQSKRIDPQSFADLELGTDQSGRVSNRLIIADEDNRINSLSGEIRLSGQWQRGALRHRATASLKARDQSRDFGGQTTLLLGTSQTGVADFRTKPNFVNGPNDQSKVRQYTLGLGYDLDWQKRGSISVAVQKSNYRKDTDFANPLLPPAISRDKPWLFSANGALSLVPGLTLYGGYVRGLEESAVAPDIAVNRNEAPPAIRTRQMDAGLRYAITPKLSLIAGVFEVRKPFFAVDGQTRFRQLGTIANRGVEVSFAGTLAPGLTIVAGTVLLDPKISGADVQTGLLGARPVGSFKRRSVANFDWKPRGQEALSLDLALESFSSLTGNRANRFNAPARETVGVGARYRFKLAETKLLFRTQVTNLLNDYGWRVSSSGGFSFTLPRTLVASLSADF